MVLGMLPLLRSLCSRERMSRPWLTVMSKQPWRRPAHPFPFQALTSDHRGLLGVPAFSKAMQGSQTCCLWL